MCATGVSLSSTGMLEEPGQQAHEHQQEHEHEHEHEQGPRCIRCSNTTRSVCGIPSCSRQGWRLWGRRYGGNQWLPLRNEQTAEVACDLEQAPALAAVHLLRPSRIKYLGSRRGIPLQRCGRRAPVPPPPPQTPHLTQSPLHQSPHSNCKGQKKPHRFAPAGLFHAGLEAYFLAASFFSFSLAITVSATLFGQAE